MPPAEPITHEYPGQLWENWHQTVRGPVHKLVDILNPDPHQSTVAGYNATRARLQAYIGEAMQGNHAIRAVGGGWSFSPVAQTDGILLNTKNLNYWFPVPANRADPGYAGRPEDLFFAQCGISVAELHSTLAPRGRSIKTCGASNGQTIAGALATGTHGAAIDVGGIQEYVVAIHLATSPDDHLWLERSSYPVADPSLPQLFGARLVRDDALFDAALVNLGSFGLVLGVMLETEPAFFLQVFRRRVPRGDALWRLVDGLDFSAVDLGRGLGPRPFHLQMVFNPYDMESGPYITAMYKETALPAGAERIARGSNYAPGDDAAAIVSRILERVTVLTPIVAGQLLKLLFPAIDGRWGTLGEVFSSTTTRGQFSSCAIGIPVGRVRESLEMLAALNPSFHFPGLFALRYVRGSKATLAFTRHAPQTCVLELDAPQSNMTRPFLEAAWAALARKGIPLTFHWGKVLPLDPGFLQQGYGAAALNAWTQARRQLLPTPELRRAFSNPMLSALGLDG
jgi:FAD/FMN-containing dehydrogenase